MLPATQDSQNTIIGTSKKRYKIPIFILIIFCVVVFVFLLISGYFLKNYGISALAPHGRIAGYDTRLWKYYLSPKKININDVFNLAKNDCYEAQITQRFKNLPPNYSAYLDRLEQDILSNLGVTPEKAGGLLFVDVEVPNTNKCWIMYAVDLKGQGAVGYQSKNGKLQLYSATLPKDRLDGVLKQINIPI
jgi:hypothetical protein